MGPNKQRKTFQEMLKLGMNARERERERERGNIENNKVLLAPSFVRKNLLFSSTPLQPLQPKLGYGSYRLTDFRAMMQLYIGLQIGFAFRSSQSPRNDDEYRLMEHDEDS